MSTPAFELFAKLSLDKKDYNKGLDDAKDDAKGFAFSFKDALAGATKLIAGAYSAASATIGVFAKQAIDSFGNYEQLAGGVKKLYGDAGDAVLQFAQEAYKTSGKSVNEYLESATQFSAALMKSLGNNGQKAAEITDMAMRAISDNVNTFGTDVEAVENAFKGLSRQNYMMIDNLKLGYAGTAQGMLQLINDSGVLGKTLTKTSELSTVGFDKMILAIQKVQEKQHIAGTTADEAMRTLQGSANATKAAWENVVNAIGTGEGLDTALNGLMTAILGTGEGTGWLAQITKRIDVVMTQAGNFIVQAAPLIADKLPALFEAIVPKLLSSATLLLKTLADYIMSQAPMMFEQGINFLHSISEGFVTGVPELLSKVLPMLQDFTKTLHDKIGIIVDAGINMLINFVKGLMNALPELIRWVPQIVINIVDVVNDNMPKILKMAWDLIKAVIKGIIDSLPALAQNAGKIVEAIWKTITAVNWINLGGKILTGILNGVKNLGSTLVGGFKNVAKQAWEGFKNGVKWTELGKNIIEGIKSGVVNAAKGLANSVVNAAKSALSSVKGFLGIKSPSRRMRDEVGKNMALGFAEGFEDYLPTDDMIDAVKDTIDGINSSGLSTMASDIGAGVSDEMFTDTSTVTNMGGIVINVYGEDKSITEIANEVSDVIESRILMNRRVFQ